MSRLLCCLRARRTDMGAALSHPQEGEACDGAGLPAAPPTMADVIRERKKKAGGAALGTLRRRIANAARRPRDNRPDRGCEHARFIRSVVSPWRLVDVFLLSEELEAGAALRDLCTQAELAREPAPALHIALQLMYTERWWCDIEIVGAGWSLCAHRCVLWARSGYFRALLANRPQSCNRVPLEGACSSLTREEVDAALLSMYSGGNTSRRHCRHHNGYDSNEHTDGDLDLVDNTGTCRSNSGSSCACTVRRGAARRAAQLLAVTRDPLATSMRYLLDSGEMSDAKLVFRTEGSCGAQYGFRSALELPCHRVLLGARSRFFRSVMSRRNSGGNGGAVCVDEKVLPRRFARALLHAAYTDQVDLSLISRNTSLPAPLPATTSAAGWSASRAGVNRLTAPAALEDVFQLYEIARFLEMSIVIQGCEDAISSALTPDTLPLVLRWSAHHHASQWVHRQAMRYLRDEFVTILSNAASANISQSALATSLASPFLQASETAALRAVLKYAHLHKHKQREPNVVWVGASSVSRRRRELSDAALRDILAPLVRHIRTEHIPPDNELLQQLVRRGIVPAPPAPPAGEEGSSAHAWLGRGSYRPARCFLPYLDEIKALLEDQPVPDAELARARRARYMHRIPDTLYMVAADRTSPPSPPPVAPGSLVTARACVCTRTMHALRTRCRELRAARARPATSLHHHQEQVNRQIALRAVREMSLPDTCAELLITDMDDTEAESVSGACETPRAERRVLPAQQAQDNAWQADCCSREGGGSLRCNSSGSLRAQELSNDNSRAGSCTRREQSARSENSHHSRSLSGSCGRESVRGLSARVPDVAMAPNANTHLLTAGYCGYPHPHPPAREYGGVVLQLDLGDGATHTPRPGSRAQRNSLAAQQSARTRDHAPVAQAISCLRARPDEDELRAAIELSVMRAYSSFQWRGVGGGGEEGAVRGGGRGATLPLPPAPGLVPSFRPDLPSAPDHNVLLAGSSPRGRTTRATRAEPSPPHLAIPHASPSPSPRRRDYRLEGGAYGGSAASSRGHSPNNYA